MDLKLEGRTAVISGGSKGIGYACARRLAAEGCHLHLIARGTADLETARQNILSSWDTRVSIHAMDLGSGENIDAFFDHLNEIDILINNAGAIPNGDLQAVSESKWRKAWDLKVFGYINMCRRAYPKMQKRNKGVIINIVGAAGERPGRHYIAGGAGNAALMAFTRALGAGSSADGIRVLAVNPGLIHTQRLETQMKRLAAARLDDEDRWPELVDKTFPPGKPDNIADLAAFLASDLAEFISGTVVTADGGYSAR